MAGFSPWWVLLTVLHSDADFSAAVTGTCLGKSLDIAGVAVKRLFGVVDARSNAAVDGGLLGDSDSFPMDWKRGHVSFLGSHPLQQRRMITLLKQFFSEGRQEAYWAKLDGSVLSEVCPRSLSMAEEGMV